MTIENALNIHRVYHLISNDIRLHKKMILTVMATILVFLALMPFHITGDSATYLSILYVGGLIISSRAFAELHDPRRACIFFMLPCSNLERFLSKWLLTAIIYPLALLVLYYACSLLSAGFSLLLYHQPLDLFPIAEGALWVSIAKYIALQSIFLLGAAVFKKYALIKTILTLGCISLLFSMLLGMLTWSACDHCIQNWWAIHNATWIIFALITPFCWVVTYLKLTEFELK